MRSAIPWRLGAPILAVAAILLGAAPVLVWGGFIGTKSVVDLLRNVVQRGL